MRTKRIPDKEELDYYIFDLGWDKALELFNLTETKANDILFYPPDVLPYRVLHIGNVTYKSGTYYDTKGVTLSTDKIGMFKAKQDWDEHQAFIKEWNKQNRLLIAYGHSEWLRQNARGAKKITE